MTYDSLEYSTESGEPFEMWELTRGTWTAYLTTGASEFYVDASKTFIPSSIQRTKIKQGQDALKDPITITLPRGDSLSSDFINIPPEQTTSVTLRRSHTGLTYAESVVRWKGRVAGASTAGETVQIVCDSIYTSIQQNGLRERMEYICQAPLYSVKCGVNQPAVRYDDTISIVSGTAITMIDLSSFADGWFTGGILEYATERRFIINHVGNVLEITRPLSALAELQEVALYPGCSHMMDDCLVKYDNIVNFQGFPWIPNRNPFAGTIK
jgi:hypothetical protein